MYTLRHVLVMSQFAMIATRWSRRGEELQLPSVPPVDELTVPMPVACRPHDFILYLQLYHYLYYLWSGAMAALLMMGVALNFGSCGA
jgi:hypothetical protein